MGTRGITRVREVGGAQPIPLVALYRQFDSYPSGHGRELAEFLFKNGKPRPVINGIGPSADEAGAFNGPGCLAAQLVAHFKREVGGFYIVPAEEAGEEWDYTLDITPAEPFKTGRITITVEGEGKTFGPFTPAQFRAWVKRRKY